MGKKPLYGALGLVWVGLALGSISSVGCMGDGQKKYPTGNIRPVQPARPPAQFNPQTPPPGGNDLNKLPPLNGVGSTMPPVSGGTSGPATEYSKFGNGTPTPPKTGGLQQVGGFEQGGKMPTGTLPGNTGPATGPSDGKDKSSLNALPPNPTIANTPGTAATQLTNFGGDPVARPIATGGMVLPPPPPTSSRDALGGTGIPAVLPANTAPAGTTMPGTPVGTSSNYGGSRTTAPPATNDYVVPGGQGPANFDPLPPLGPRNP